jgi:hypothetical protein
MMSIHHTCVIPRRRYLCGAWLRQAARLHDLKVGFVSLHRQCLCGNVIPLLVFKDMNTTTILLLFNYINRSWETVCRKILFSASNPNRTVIPTKLEQSSVGFLDTGVSRSTYSWAPSTVQLRPRGESTTEAQRRRPS